MMTEVIDCKGLRFEKSGIPPHAQQKLAEAALQVRALLLSVAGKCTKLESRSQETPTAKVEISWHG